MKKISLPGLVAAYLLCAGFLTACYGSGANVTAVPNDPAASLKGAFDVVETFDDLQDWDGSAQTGYHYGASFAPKRADGGPPRWDFFTNDRATLEYRAATGAFAPGDVVTGISSGATGKVERCDREGDKRYLQLMPPLSGKFLAGETIRNQAAGTRATFVAFPKWIANHGSDYVWGGTGKSLRINYNDFSGGMAGYGPSRLGAFLGDGASGKSGYRKIYLFMMVKFQPGFFKKNADGTFVSVGTLKMFDLDSGFTSTEAWGSAAERAQLNPASARLAQLQSAYGPNASIMDIKGGGFTYPRSLFYYESPFIAKMTPGGIDYDDLPTQDLINHDRNENDIAPYYLSGDWFGLEMAAAIGSVGNADGTTDFWIYDKSGHEKGHFSATGLNRLNFFEHRYNKVTLGGNRICAGYGTCPAGQDNRWYADDVIIHHDRIGPSYFKLLAAARAAANQPARSVNPKK